MSRVPVAVQNMLWANTPDHGAYYKDVLVLFWHYLLKGGGH